MTRIFLLLALLMLPAAAQTAPKAPPVGALTQAWGTVQVQDLVVEGPGESLQGNGLAPPPPNPNGALNKIPSQMLPWTLIGPGQPLLSGATLRTGANSGAVVSLEEGVEVQLAEQTTLVLPRAGQTDVLKVLTGRIWLRTERPLKLETPQGDFAVRGTELVLDAGEAQALLSVMEGSVEVGTVRAEAGQELQLAAGDLAGAPVQADVANRRAWVQQRTTSEQLSLWPYYPEAEAREAARADAVALLEAEPANPEGKLWLARVYLDEGRLPEAARLLEDLPEARAERGRLALLEGRSAEASELLQGLSEPRARLDRGAALWARAELAAAESEFRAVLEEQPENAYALAALGYLIEFQKGHYRRAEALLGQAVDLRPGDASLHRQLGDIYAALRRYGAALDQYHRVLELQPQESPQTALRIGTLLLRLGRPGEASAYFQRYREETPSAQADLHYHLAAGFSALSDGNLEVAMEHAEEALALAEGADPGLRHLAYDLQGLVLARRRDFEQAAAAYTAALKLQPGDPFVLNDLGVTLRSLGDFEEALDSLLEARRKAPDSPAIRHNLGRLYILLQQYQRAQSEFEQGLVFAPDDPALMQGLGDALRFQQRDGPASRLGTQSSLLDPLLIPPRRDLVALLGDFQPGQGPTYVASYSGYRGPVSFYLQGIATENFEPDGSDLLSGLAQVGWIASPSDRVFAEFGPSGSFESDRFRSGVLQGQDRANLARNALHYYREISAPTDLWVRIQQNEFYSRTQNRVRTPEDLRDSRSGRRLRRGAIGPRSERHQHRAGGLLPPGRAPGHPQPLLFAGGQRRHRAAHGI